MNHDFRKAINKILVFTNVPITHLTNATRVQERKHYYWN